MYEQKSAVAALLRQISLKYEAAVRGLTSLAAGRAKHSSSRPGWNRPEPITSTSHV
ncbi:MAG: hypothetical protein ACR2H5_12190 [Ktedonobacteraceae bacterium]